MLNWKGKAWYIYTLHLNCELSSGMSAFGVHIYTWIFKTYLRNGQIHVHAQNARNLHNNWYIVYIHVTNMYEYVDFTVLNQHILAQFKSLLDNWNMCHGSILLCWLEREISNSFFPNTSPPSVKS